METRNGNRLEKERNQHKQKDAEEQSDFTGTARNAASAVHVRVPGPGGGKGLSEVMPCRPLRWGPHTLGPVPDKDLRRLRGSVVWMAACYSVCPHREGLNCVSVVVCLCIESAVMCVHSRCLCGLGVFLCSGVLECINRMFPLSEHLR